MDGPPVDTAALIGISIKAERSRQGLDLDVLALRADLDPYDLMDIEAGMAEVDIPTLFRLALALNVTPKDLYRDAGNDPRVGRLRDHSDIISGLGRALGLGEF